MEGDPKWGIFLQSIGYRFRVVQAEGMRSEGDYMEVDIYRAAMNGYSCSHRYSFKFSEEGMTVEEVEANKRVHVETDPDKVLGGGTFKIGRNPNSQGQKMTELPHFDIVKRAEAERRKQAEDDAKMQDEEQDEEDDVDV